VLGVIGDVVQDVVVWMQEPLRPATDTLSEITTRRGGSAANVAAFAGPRHPTRFIGRVGDDLGGDAVRRELQERGVDVRLQVGEITGMIVVLIDDRGERMMFPSRGESARIAPVDDAWLEGVEILHLTGYSLASDPSASSVLDAARRVRAAGGRISIDLSSTGMIELHGRDAFADLVRDLAPDFISANEDETALLQLVEGDGAGPLARDLPDTVVLARAGQDPTRIIRGPEVVATVPVEPVDGVRDMTGAGDAFNAGFLTAVLRGAGLEEAVESGHALSRRVLAHPGASEGPESLPA